MRDHQYALDINGKWINAKKTIYKKHCVYFCDCPNKHRMKLVKPSGKEGRRSFCDYFAHIVKRGVGSRPILNVTCAKGGESVLHRRAKHLLREMVGKYSFSVFRCSQCEEETSIETDACSVKIEVRSENGKWRYDCLLSKGSTSIAALEVVHTHYTSEEKVKSVRSSGLNIAEFRAHDVMGLLDGRKHHIENLQIKVGKCYRCLVEESLKWCRDCYVDEFCELEEQESAVAFHYSRVEKLHRVLAMQSDLRKSKSLLKLGMNLRVRLCIPRIGEITFSKSEEWEYGLLVSGFNVDLPTSHICIFVFDNDSDAKNKQWQHRSVKRDFHVFLRCSTIINQLGSLAREIVYLKDCRWPILKQLEQSNGLCANCGRFGHISDNCFAQFCIRCGRTGHVKRQCFAMTSTTGEYL
jgi:hypothetical protein